MSKLVRFVALFGLLLGVAVDAAEPIRLRVLSYNDLPRTHPGYHLFLAHHLGKEVLAKLGLGATLTETLGEGASLL